MDPMLEELLRFGTNYVSKAIGLPPGLSDILFHDGLRHDVYDDGDTWNDRRMAALEEVKRKDGSVTLWIGTRETGKTVGAGREAEFLGRETYAVSPEEKPPAWMHWIKLDELKKVPHRVTLILDDLPAYMSNRDYNNAVVQAIERIVPLCRHEKKWHLIFNTQSTAQADKYILDCDLAFFKPLGVLMSDAERPNIRRIYRELVDPYFQNRSEMWIRKHAFMKSRTYVGGISIQPAVGHMAQTVPPEPAPAQSSGAKSPGERVLIAEKNANGVYEVVEEE